MPKGPRKLPGVIWDQKTGAGVLRASIPGGGPRLRRRFNAKTWDEVEKTWLKFRREVAAAESAPAVPHIVKRPPPERLIAPTMNEYLDAFWDGIEARHSDGTKERNKWRLAAIRKALGETRLDVISTPLLQTTVATWAQEYAPPTINGYLQLVKLILRDAHERRNPKGTRILKEINVGKWPMVREERLKLELSSEERAKLLDVFSREDAFKRHVLNKTVKRGGQARNVPWRSYWDRFRAIRPVVVLALETGLRRGDLFDLRWDEVHLDVGEIWRRQSKTEESVIVTISPAALEALQALGGARFKNLLGTRAKVVPFDWGRVLRSFTLAKELAEIKRRFRWHDLRHSFGSHLLALGAPLAGVRDQMGHASIESTQRYARPGAAGRAAIRAAMGPLPEDAAKVVTYDKEAQVTNSEKVDAPPPSGK